MPMKKFFKKSILPLVILSAGILSSLLFIFFKPSPPRKNYVPVATFITCSVPSYEDRNSLITGFGSVIPDKTLELTPQVSGMVLNKSKSLEPGGFVFKNEDLIQIDPAEYTLSVEQQKYSVAQAEFNLKVEKGRKNVAEKEWELIGKSINKNPLGEELARRDAHIKEKKSALDAAKSKLEIANLNLKRTKISCPFDSFVKSCSLQEGALVTAGIPIASLVGTDRFFIEASIELQLLRQIKENAEVTITVRTNDTNFITRKGYIHRILPEVDSEGRMGRLLVGLDDPLDLKKKSKNPIYLGTYVKISLDGSFNKNLLKVNRKHIRENNNIWVMNKENKLEYRKVVPVISLEKYVYCKSSLLDTDLIVTSNLPSPLPGMLLRTDSSKDNE